MTEIKQPKIRFKGHINDWEQRKLSDMSESLEYGLNSASTKFDGENKYLRITDIDDSTRQFIKEGITSPDADVEKLSNYLLENGDILFARTGASVGKTYIYKESDGKVFYAGFLIRARISEEYNSDFVFQNTFTNKYNNFIKVTSQRSGQPGVNAKEYGDFEMFVPKIEEQKKIGEFFKTLDETIALHQQKLEATKQFKQTMLKKMFPKNGETTPEIRFKGFTDDWENKKFLDICSVKKGTQLNKDTLSKEKTETFKYPVYNGSVNPIGYTTESNKEKGLIMTEGGDVGRVLFSETPFWSSGHSYNISSLDNNIYYLQYLFESNYGKINSKGLGVTIKNLSLNSLKQIILTVNSSYQEQELIGNYFKELDNQINDLEQKLETYKEFKKSMLQKMFI